jgi:hypothetical protein
MMPKDSFSERRAFLIDSEYRARSTAFSATHVCVLHARGCSQYWSSSFGGIDLHLSISSFSVAELA